MLRGTDVEGMMNKVKVTLKTRKGGFQSPVMIRGDTGETWGISNVRKTGEIRTDFDPGSERRLIGRVIRALKIGTRRSIGWYVEPIAKQTSSFNEELITVLERIWTEYMGLAGQIESLRNMQEGFRQELYTRFDAFHAALDQVTRRMKDPEDTSDEILPTMRHALSYKEFEDQHRNPQEVKRMLSIYVDLFRRRKRVLDVGCGRGEFVEMLASEGISAYGIDIDEGMVRAARLKRIEVIHADVIDHLTEIDPGSIDAVFSSQVAEHLSVGQLIRLLELAYRKLAPGGLVVLETPNPEALFIFHGWFYVDPTHVKPIHPEAMKWLLQSTGFQDIRIERILPVPEGTRLEPLPADLVEKPGWSTVASNLERLNTLLYGPQHYAAIATKPERSDER